MWSFGVCFRPDRLTVCVEDGESEVLQAPGEGLRTVKDVDLFDRAFLSEVEFPPRVFLTVHRVCLTAIGIAWRAIAVDGPIGVAVVAGAGLFGFPLASDVDSAIIDL